MKKFIYFISISFIVFSSCKKSDINFCDTYVAGEIIIGTNENINLQEIFTFINARGYKIISSFGTYYESSLPIDSLDYVKNILSTKPYMNRDGWNGNAYLHYQSNKIMCVNQMMDMDINNQNDWLNTVQLLQLTQKDNVTTFLVGVKEGKEKKIIKSLIENPYIKWAELNCTGEIQPH